MSIIFSTCCFVAFIISPTLELVGAAYPTIPPPYVSDLKLAQSPIVVVGGWNGAPLTAHRNVKGNTIVDLEGRTELVIQRIIAGDVEPGEHKILLFPFVGWEQDGRIMSYTSTEEEGDVEDVSKSNLWFLSQKRSW